MDRTGTVVAQFVILSFSTQLYAQFSASGSTTTGKLPGKHIQATLDDGPGPQSLRLAEFCKKNGDVCTAFHVACRYDVPQLQPDQLSSLCMKSFRTFSVSYILDLVNRGMDIFNHGKDHLGEIGMKSNKDLLLFQVYEAQRILDENNIQLNHQKKFHRAPGFSADSESNAELNSDPRSKGMEGSVGYDLGGVGTMPDGTEVGGDWMMYELGYTSDDCADFYARQARERCIESGCISIHHEQHEKIVGGVDPAVWGAECFQKFRTLLPDFTFDPLDASPGHLGNIRLDPIMFFSDQFGSEDGNGLPVVGNIPGFSSPIVCKARQDSKVWCGTAVFSPDGTVALGPVTPWLAINDPEWPTFGYKFWIVDGGLMYATSKGFWFSPATSQGFDKNPILKPSPFSAAAGFDMQALALQNRIHFGNFTGIGPQYPDILIADSGRFLVSKNYVTNFGVALVWADGLSSTLDWSTLQVVKNAERKKYDGLIVRDSIQGQVLQFSTNSTFFGGFGFSSPEKSMEFSGQLNHTPWNDRQNSQTFHLTTWGSTTLLTAGSPTGMAYTTIVPGNNGIGTFRPGWHHLCNTCYTNLTDWKGEEARQAAGVVWVDLDGSGFEWCIFIHSNRLDIAKGVINTN